MGSNLAAAAIHRQCPVLVFDNLSRFGSAENLAWLRRQGTFEFVWGDVRNRSDVEASIERFQPDVVFHLAGQVAMTTSLERPELDFQTNALGTMNVLESVRKHRPDAIILYSSSNKVYGDLEQYTYREETTRYVCDEFPNGFPETIPLDFRTPYGCSKGAADQYLLDYHRMFGVRTVVFRHSSMYGGRQFATYDQGWVGWFVTQALETQRNRQHRFTVSGNGKQVRDLLHADDVVSLYFGAVENIDRVVGQAFNVGGGVSNASSVRELLNYLAATLDVELNIENVARRRSDQQVFVADIGKCAQLTGWQPSVSKEAGILRSIEWAKQLAGSSASR